MSVNQTEYAWEDVAIVVMGRVLERVLDIEYDTEVDKKQIYGRGSKVKGIQRMNEKPGGSLSLGQSEYEAMVRAAQKIKPNGKITDLVFDIQVHYLDAESLNLVKDRIVGAEFTKGSKGMKQGDSDMEIKLDFLCMDILYNVV